MNVRNVNFESIKFTFGGAHSLFFQDLSSCEAAEWGIRLKRKAYFNRKKALRVLFAQDLYAAEAADGGYYENI